MLLPDKDCCFKRILLLFPILSMPFAWGAEITPNMSLGSSVLQEGLGANQMIFSEIQGRMQEIRMSAMPDGTRCHGTWGKILGHHAWQRSQDGFEGYKDNLWGLMVGTDALLSESALLGAGLNGTELKIHTNVTDSTLKVHTLQGTVYGQILFDETIYWNGIFLLGVNHYKSRQQIPAEQVVFTPEGHSWGWQTSGETELGYDWTKGSVHWIPFASLYYSHLQWNGYTEVNGETASEVIQDQGFDALIAGSGIRVAYDIFYNDTFYRPQAHFRLFYDVINDPMQTTSRFIDDSESFITTGFSRPRMNYNVGANLTTLDNGQGFVLTIGYDFDYQKRYQSHAGYLRVRQSW